MPRLVKILLWCLAGVAVLVALCAVLLFTFNWNHARPWVNRQLSSLAQRPVAIEGDLSVRWRRPEQRPDHGWQRWVPWPHISAEKIVVGNPQGFQEGQHVQMAEAEYLGVVINPLALLAHTVQLAELDLRSAQVSLFRNEEGENNWTLEKKENKEPSRWKFDVQKVSLEKVAIRVQDAGNDLDVNTEVSSLKERSKEGYGLSWKSTGSYHGADVSGEGSAGGVLSLQQGGKPYPLKAGVQVGETLIAIEGSVTRPQALAALDVRLKLEGDTMADLYPLLGVTLPNTPPYETEGRLIGVLDTEEDKWTYENFSGRVGSSDLEGTLHYFVREPRPLLTGELQSKLLRFKDLGPLIGVESSGTRPGEAGKKKGQPEQEEVTADREGGGSKAANQAKREMAAARQEQSQAQERKGPDGPDTKEGSASAGREGDEAQPREPNREGNDAKKGATPEKVPADKVSEGEAGKKEAQPDKKSEKKPEKKEVKQPANKALPVQPIDTKSWGRMDADVKFTGKEILRNKALPLDNIEAHIKLNDSVLNLDPLNFGFAGGNLTSTIHLEGKADPIKARLKLSARHLKLKQLFPTAQSMRASFGELHGDSALTGEGNSIAELLGHSNGEVQALISRGTISHFLLEAAGLNVANMVIVKLFGDEQVILNCLGADFSVKNGMMTTRTFRMDTQDAVVDVSGQINLRTERFDLDIKPENKSLRIFTLRTPLYVKGTFKNPDVGVQKGPLIARAGAAVALGVIATPFAALLPLLNVGTDEGTDCAKLLGKAGDQPKAPPPGETKKDSGDTGDAKGKPAPKASANDSDFVPATDAEKRRAARPIP